MNMLKPVNKKFKLMFLPIPVTTNMYFVYSFAHDNTEKASNIYLEKYPQHLIKIKIEDVSNIKYASLR